MPPRECWFEIVLVTSTTYLATSVLILNAAAAASFNPKNEIARFRPKSLQSTSSCKRVGKAIVEIQLGRMAAACSLRIE
jgi:hypothetical protein